MNEMQSQPAASCAAAEEIRMNNEDTSNLAASDTVVTASDTGEASTEVPVTAEAPKLPELTLEDRCEMCKFAMNDMIGVFKRDFEIGDEEFKALQDRVLKAVEAVRPTDEEIAKLTPQESLKRYGSTLAHYALMTYCAAGTLKNALEFMEPIKEASNGADNQQG